MVQFLRERELAAEDTYFQYLCPDWKVMSPEEAKQRGCIAGLQDLAKVANFFEELNTARP